MLWTYDDGGRELHEFENSKLKGKRDCVTRSIAIATGLPYKEVWDLILKYAENERGHGKSKRKSHPGTGVFTPLARRLLADLGWEWVPTMGIGTGCTVHLNPDELPDGILIVRTSRHFTAVEDGVIHDTHDPSRGETRCVYGYWREPK